MRHLHKKLLACVYLRYMWFIREAGKKRRRGKERSLSQRIHFTLCLWCDGGSRDQDYGCHCAKSETLVFGPKTTCRERDFPTEWKRERSACIHLQADDFGSESATGSVSLANRMPEQLPVQSRSESEYCFLYPTWIQIPWLKSLWSREEAHFLHITIFHITFWRKVIFHSPVFNRTTSWQQSVRVVETSDDTCTRFLRLLLFVPCHLIQDSRDFTYSQVIRMPLCCCCFCNDLCCLDTTEGADSLCLWIKEQEAE